MIGQAGGDGRGAVSGLGVESQAITTGDQAHCSDSALEGRYAITMDGEDDYHLWAAHCSESAADRSDDLARESSSAPSSCDSRSRSSAAYH